MLIVILLLVACLVSSQCRMCFVLCDVVACGRFVDSCRGVQCTCVCFIVIWIALGSRPVIKVTVKNNVVSTLYDIHLYYSASKCDDDPVLITTTVFVLFCFRYR